MHLSRTKTNQDYLGLINFLKISVLTKADFRNSQTCIRALVCYSRHHADASVILFAQIAYVACASRLRLGTFGICLAFSCIGHSEVLDESVHGRCWTKPIVLVLEALRPWPT